MTEHGKDCSKFFDRLSELLDGELDRMTGDELRAHLEACPECKSCFANFEKSVRLFRKLGPDPIPPAFLDRLKQYIRESGNIEEV